MNLDQSIPVLTYEAKPPVSTSAGREMDPAALAGIGLALFIFLPGISGALAIACGVYVLRTVDRWPSERLAAMLAIVLGTMNLLMGVGFFVAAVFYL